MFHNVMFIPGQPDPEFVIPLPQEQGPPIISLNSDVVFPQKPAPSYDGTGLWSSGVIGIDTMPLPGGKTFSMTFSKAGTCDYICAIHRVLGMEGSITVTGRAVTPVTELSTTNAEFPEGLAIDQMGNIYAGMAPTGEVSTFAKLPQPGDGFMLGLEFDSKGDLYVAMASTDAATHGVWRVSADGSDSSLFAPLAMEVFPNVLEFDSQDNMYVSDTTGSPVWKIDRQANVIKWDSDPLLMGAVPPGTPLGMSIGANGVNLDPEGKNLYVSVSEFARIVRIPVNQDGSAGAAEVFVEDMENMGMPDGMTFGPSGDLYVASVGSDKVVRISPGGAITTLDAGSPLQNPSDVKFGMGADANTLYVANFALFRGGRRRGSPELPV